MREFEHMSFQELLAFVLKTSPENGTVKEVTKKYQTAKSLYQAPVEEIMEIKGLGGQKALLLKAILELGIRMVGQTEKEAPTISSPTDALNVLRPRMEYLDREHFMVVSLNTKNMVISIETASIGSLASSIVHPREIFRNAIRIGAASVILAHNHPSGNPTPSAEDL